MLVMDTGKNDNHSSLQKFIVQDMLIRGVLIELY